MSKYRLEVFRPNGNIGDIFEFSDMSYITVNRSMMESFGKSLGYHIRVVQENGTLIAASRADGTIWVK